MANLPNNMPKIEIMYWKLCQFISQTFDNYSFSINTCNLWKPIYIYENWNCAHVSQTLCHHFTMFNKYFSFMLTIITQLGICMVYSSSNLPMASTLTVLDSNLDMSLHIFVLSPVSTEHTQSPAEKHDQSKGSESYSQLI